MSIPHALRDAAVQWIRTSDALTVLAERLSAVDILALDSESDSLHHFPERVCLVQVAIPSGEVFLIDPLSLGRLDALAPLMANSSIVKVFHGAAYDLASFGRDFGFRVAGLFDTMVAAQFLGMRELGLNALVHQLLGVTAVPSRQKDDWAARPLMPAQERYAAEDVCHSIALYAILRDRLTVLGRESWVAEECAALEETPAALRVFDPDDAFALKGARQLDGRGLAILRELFVCREAWAHASGRPPFKVLGGDLLVRLAAARPARIEELSAFSGCTPRVCQRYGAGIVAAIGRGLATPDAALPVLRGPRKPKPSPQVQRHTEALLVWRTQAAERYGLDPGLLLPRRLIEAIAAAAPLNVGALSQLEGIRQWRVTTFGPELLEVLRKTETDAKRGMR